MPQITTLSITEIAIAFNMSKSSTVRMALVMKFPCIRIKNKLRYPITILTPWLELNIPEKAVLLKNYLRTKNIITTEV